MTLSGTLLIRISREAVQVVGDGFSPHFGKPPEYAHVASTRDGFGFLLEHLLATDAELADGKDAAFRILDMARQPAPRRH
jgi:hypothetical protein